MKDVPLFSKVSYFISGFFSKESADPFFGSTEETFKDKIKEMGLCVEDKDFFPMAVFCLVRYTGFFGRAILRLSQRKAPRGNSLRNWQHLSGGDFRSDSRQTFP